MTGLARVRCRTHGKKLADTSKTENWSPMIMNYIKKFRVKPGSRVDLSEIDAGFKDQHESHEQALPEIEAYSQKLHDLQYLMYAEGKRSLLICLQGRDAAGKDGTINHVLGAMNPQGCTVTGFKVPSKEEAAHDFLWRYHQATPRRGTWPFSIVRITKTCLWCASTTWFPRRYGPSVTTISITLKSCCTTTGRTFSSSTFTSTHKNSWNDSSNASSTPHGTGKSATATTRNAHSGTTTAQAFEDALSNCSTEYAPWFVIPSNHKWFRNLAISRIVAETLESLDMKFPEPTVDIGEIKQKYHEIVEEEAEAHQQTGATEQASEKKKDKKNKKNKKKKKNA